MLNFDLEAKASTNNASVKLKDMKEGLYYAFYPSSEYAAQVAAFKVEEGILTANLYVDAAAEYEVAIFDAVGGMSPADLVLAYGSNFMSSRTVSYDLRVLPALQIVIGAVEDMDLGDIMACTVDLYMAHYNDLLDEDYFRLDKENLVLTYPVTIEDL